MYIDNEKKKKILCYIILHTVVLVLNAEINSINIKIFFNNIQSTKDLQVSHYSSSPLLIT